MATQSDYENALLDAINYCINNRVENLDRDKTITATIVSCSNALIGEYKVSYNDGFLDAYAQDGASFSPNQTVYVLVPEGDFSKRKTIVGKASNVSDDNNLTFVSSLLNSYNMIGQNVISVKDERDMPIGLNSYYKDDYVLLYDRDLPDESILIVDQDAFASYVKKASALLIEATFNTRLPREHRLTKTGKYGVQYVLAFKDQDQPDQIKHVSYVLDTNNMTGNPLLYTIATNQYAIYPIDTENFLYIESILAFSNDFVAEDNTTQITLWGDDIFAKEFEIYGLQEISATDGDYTLRLSMPSGGIFKTVNSSEILTVVGTTTYQINTDISDSTTYYWFSKDDRVSSSSEYYQMYGGAGWKYLKGKGANKTLTTNASENRAYENVYLVVAVYKESVVLKQTFTLYNEAARRDISITSDLGLKFSFDRGVPTLTCLINGVASDFDVNHSDDLFSFAWSKIDETGTVTALNKTYEELEAEYKQGVSDGIGYSALTAIKNQMLSMEGVEFNRNVLKYPVKQIDSKATFSCSVYLRENKDAEDYFVGSAEITLQNDLVASPTDYYILIQNGDQVFQYSESGVSPASDRYTDPLEILPLECHFYDPAGLEVNNETYNVKWVIPVENSLIVIPQEGMETNPANGKIEWYTQRTCPVMIDESYDYQALNNQITCVVTYDGQEYQQDTDFLFVKVGDNGTNGTDMVGKISAIKEPEEGRLALVLQNGQSPSWNNGESISRAALQYELYQRNELLNIENVTWSMSGGRCKQMSVANGIVSWEPKNEDGYYTNLIVKAQTSLEGQTYYAFYPVPVIAYKTSVPYDVVLDKTKLLKDILYNSDGRNPLYNKNQGIFFKLSGLATSKYVKYTVQGGANDDSITAAFGLSFERDSKDSSTSIGKTYAANDNMGAYVQAYDVYDGSYTNNRVLVQVFSSEVVAQQNGNPEVEIYIPIHMSLNTFGLASLNSWDGNHIEINEDSNYIIAPQIGAGIKTNENKFTGVVMGKAQTYDQDEPVVGLLGYSEGKQSIFLDAETGNAIFGLPEDQASTNNQYTEGRIELIPGGESKISAWNIGSRALYNMNRNGAGVPEDDMDPYNSSYSGEYAVNGAQIGIPYDAQGIILNANPAYASFKGMPLDENSGIDFEGANTVVRPGDSLEVEIDPSKPSIFSIFRHTPYEGSTDTGKWHRYPIVGINSSGQFYTNAIEDGESSMGIGKIGAFGSSAADGKYIGAQFAYSGGTGTPYNIFKFFVDETGQTSDLESRAVYISAGSRLNNEYPRPFKMYGKSIELYANDTMSTEKTSTASLSITSDVIRLGEETSYISIPNLETDTYSIVADSNFEIAANEDRNSSVTLGTTTFKNKKSITSDINYGGSRSDEALKSTILGKINVSGYSDMNLTSDSQSGSWQIKSSESGKAQSLDGTTVTNHQLYLGNSSARLELNGNTVSRFATNNGIRISSTGGNGIGVESSKGSINLDASWSGAAAYLHLTPASDGYSQFYLNSGYGSVRSVGSAQGYTRNGIEISDGLFTDWGEFTGKISGTNNSIQAKNNIQSSSGGIIAKTDIYTTSGIVQAKAGNVKGDNFQFNESKSWDCLGAARSSSSLEAHLKTIYSLIQQAYNRANTAYDHASDVLSTINGRGYATQSWCNGRFALSGHTHSGYVSNSTFNSHSHKVTNSAYYLISYGQNMTIDGHSFYAPGAVSNAANINTSAPN